MVAIKKLNPPATRAEQNQRMTRSGRVTSFKIYAEADKVKRSESLQDSSAREKTALCNNSGYLLKTSDLKSNVKHLEKSKIKADKSVKLNGGRKVLADISNMKRGTFDKTDSGKVLGAGKGKTLHVLNYAKDSGKTEASSSDKREGKNRSVKLPVNQEIARGDKTQPTDEIKNIQKIANSDKPKTRFQGRNSTTGTAAGMKSVVKPLRLTRKSMPVLKQFNRTSGGDKESLEKSERIRGNHGLPVKPTVRNSIVAKSSKLSSRPLGNRVSDGFLLRASTSQAKPDTKVLPRKSLKPTTRNVTTVFNARTISKSNQILAKKKLGSFGRADLPKKEQNNSSLRKEEVIDTSQDSQQITNPEESSSTGDATKTQTEIVSRRKSARRSSFTAALISQPKFPKECSKVALPDIYDSLNHLEVSDYVDDIYQYYWVMEAQNPPLDNYMEIQRDITPQMRGILINWLIEVHMKFDLMDETLFLTIVLLDRYLSLENIKKNEMQLVGITALMLASKYEDFWHPRVADLISISAESYTRDQVLNMEKTMLKKLKFRLNQPTLYVFMLRFIRAAQADKKFEHLAFYLIELSLVQYEALKYNPSMLCASAIYVARRTMKMSPPWTPLLVKHTRYEESQIRDCAEMILKFHKAAKTSLLRVTHEKYMKTRHSKIASLNPLSFLEKS